MSSKYPRQPGSRPGFDSRNDRKTFPFAICHFRFSFGDFSGPRAPIFMFDTQMERYSLVDYEFYGDILIRSSLDRQKAF